MNTKTIKIVFVCVASIWRSPLAKTISEGVVKAGNFKNNFEFSCAGLYDWHKGYRWDIRARLIAERRGCSPDGIVKSLTLECVKNNDYIVVMDNRIGDEVYRRFGDEYWGKIVLLGDLGENSGYEINDGYFDYSGGDGGFKTISDLCIKLCEEIDSGKKPPTLTLRDKTPMINETRTLLEDLEDIDEWEPLPVFRGKLGILDNLIQIYSGVELNKYRITDGDLSMDGFKLQIKRFNAINDSKEIILGKKGRVIMGSSGDFSWIDIYREKKNEKK